MYAIVQLGSLQYKVCEGDTIDVQRLQDKEGKTLTLDKVLFFAEGQTVKIGQPYLQDVKVIAKVLEHHLGKKLVSYRYRRRKNSAWKKGHRQRITALNITKISPNK